MRIYKTLAAAAGMGLLFAWMESVFLQYGLLQRLAAIEYEGMNAVVIFLAVHALTYLFAAFFAPGEKGERPRCAIAACLMLSLPLLIGLAQYLPASFSAVAALSGMIFSSVGAALLIGLWALFLSSLIPDDVALVFGLAPLVAAFVMRFAALSHILLLILGAPLFSALLLLLPSSDAHDESPDAIQASSFPFWRLALFLFCLYAANGFLLSLMPELFPSPFPRTDQSLDWIPTISALGVAVVFRFYPRAELRTFYKGAFPFIAASLFLLLFSPLKTLSRFFMETGLAFLDLYAWLLLIYFASRAGEKRNAVIHGGIFLIVLAGATAHLHLLLRNGAGGAIHGASELLIVVIPGVCLLLIMLALWDGREIPLQWERQDTRSFPERDSGEETNFDHEKMPHPHEESASEKEEEMLLRMKLMEFNLTRQETEIALLLLQGLKDRNICSLLYISQNTLKYHLRNIYRKTGSANRLELKNNVD